MKAIKKFNISFKIYKKKTISFRKLPIYNKKPMSLRKGIGFCQQSGMILCVSSFSFNYDKIIVTMMR